MGDSTTLRVDIARILEADCRLSPEEIGRMLAVSADVVAREIAEMEASGAIVRYSARINWDKLDGPEQVFAFIGVQATPEREVGFDGIARRLVHFPEVHSLYLISGAQDFDVVLQGNSMRDIAHFVARRLAVIPGVRSTATQFVLQTYKRDGDVLMDAEKPDRLSVTP